MYFQIRLFTVFIFIFKFILLPRNKEYIRFEKTGFIMKSTSTVTSIFSLFIFVVLNHHSI